MGRFAAIVPAYDEERTVGDVVRTLVRSGEFEDVIVISDGSTDGTAEAARRAGATVVHELPAKSGKGAAMLHGLRHTSAPYVFFADADLKGFTVEHVRMLVEPVRSGRLAMTASLRDRGPIANAFERVMPLIGGERAMRREVIEAIPPKFLRGFRVEAAMNYHCRIRGWKYAGILLPGLTLRTKVDKVGLWRAIPQYLEMTYEVVSAIVEVRLARLAGRFVADADRH